jgi:hypothetical protein
MRFFSLGNNLSRTAHDEADVDYVWMSSASPGFVPAPRGGRSGRAAEFLPTTPKGWHEDHPAGRGPASVSQADWSQAIEVIP